MVKKACHGCVKSGQVLCTFTLGTKPNSLNLTNQAESTKMNKPKNQTYQTKYTKPNLFNQTCKTKSIKPIIPNQIYGKSKYSPIQVWDELGQAQSQFESVFTFFKTKTQQELLLSLFQLF